MRAKCQFPGISCDAATGRGLLAMQKYQQPYYFLMKQLMWSGMGLAALYAVIRWTSAMMALTREGQAVDAHDAFGVERVALDQRNLEDALTASGSIPMVCDPVVDIAGAPRGDCWDGGLVDYHLLLPHARHDGIVLYPHFAPHVTPGWLDKFLPWRRAPRAHPWLANVLVVAPSAAFVARLPNRKLPDRSDFYRYDIDHDSRIRDWERAIAECERFADAAMRWLERPDPSIVGGL